MFNELTLEGLRGVGRVELRFQPDSRVRTLFGPNGVGKTKCLEAIYQWLLLTNRVFVEEIGALRGDQLVVAVATDDSGFRVTLPERVFLPKALLVEEASAQLHQEPVLLLGARGRSSLGAISHLEQTLGVFAERRKRYFGEILGLINSGTMTEAGMSTDVRGWFVRRAQSVNPYQKDADNRRIEIDAVLEMLNAIDDRIDAQTLRIDGSNRVFLQVENQLRGLDELSSGFMSLVKLMQSIVAGYANFTNEPNLRHVRGVVLIDEIESHLHARWQAHIIPTLKALLPNTTFFIATHSPLVLAQLEEGEAYLLERDGDGVVRTKMIDSPNRRAFIDVLDSTLGVDLNALKREAMERGDQSAAKQKLLGLLAERAAAGDGRP